MDLALKKREKYNRGRIIFNVKELSSLLRSNEEVFKES